MAQYFEYQQHQHFSHQDQMHRMSAHYADIHETYAMAPVATAPRTNETKPRLGKDEVDILEREFKKNPKPTTQTKRQFADDMRVELARINNWFQNRRAKRKQEKKQEAYEAGQAQDVLGQYSEPSSPDFNYGNQYFGDSHMLPVQQPPAPFGLPSGPPPPVAPFNPQYSDPSSASMESLHRTMAAAQAASEHDEYDFVDHDSMNTFRGGSLIHDSANSDRAHFPSPEESVVNFDQYSYPSAFVNNIYNNSSQRAELQSPPEEHHTPTLFSAYPTSSEVEVSAPQAVTAFPSQLLTQFDSLPQQANGSNSDSQSPENSSASTLAIGFHDIAESDETSASPPAPSNPFRFPPPPPPMDIASRRKKVQHKPAALIADTWHSNRPSMGPRTVSHAEGFRRPMDSPVSSPMRRIVSAGGNRNVLSGRVYKSGVESAQRSPINLGNFPESFMEQNFHTIRVPPSLTAGSSLNSSLAPPTPMSPREREMTLVKRETSRSTASPNEGSMNFVFNAGTGAFTTMEGDQNLASPPETPQAQIIMHPSSNHWQTIEFPEKQWSFEVSDEPLYTPAHETFPLELHMPQPAYLTSMSQPVTPAFGQFNPNFLFAHEGDSPQYTLSTQPHSDFHSEYSFPDTHYMSPSMAKQKTFQFSHTTPADFSEK